MLYGLIIGWIGLLSHLKVRKLSVLHHDFFYSYSNFKQDMNICKILQLEIT